MLDMRMFRFGTIVVFAVNANMLYGVFALKCILLSTAR